MAMKHKTMNNMKTYKLIVIEDGERVSKYPDAEVKGFAEAEKKADELLDKYVDNYPLDSYVVCVEDESEMYWDDYLCYVQDRYGERFWMKMKQGTYCKIGLRSLTETEQEELDLMRDEKEVHIWDLDEDELKKLRKQICIGSCFYSDFKNSFGIDTNEVMMHAEAYEDYIAEEELEDTPQEFADYIIYSQA